MFVLVLITTLTTTPVQAYPDFESCLRMRVQLTQQSPQYAVACLPATSEEDLRNRLSNSSKDVAPLIKKIESIK